MATAMKTRPRIKIHPFEDRVVILTWIPRFYVGRGRPCTRMMVPEKVESVLEHVAEGCGVRQTGRLCRVAPNTVARYSRLAGQHAEDAHDDLVAVSPPHDRGPVR